MAGAIPYFFCTSARRSWQATRRTCRPRSSIHSFPSPCSRQHARRSVSLEWRDRRPHFEFRITAAAQAAAAGRVSVTEPHGLSKFFRSSYLHHHIHRCFLCFLLISVRASTAATAMTEELGVGKEEEEDKRLKDVVLDRTKFKQQLQLRALRVLKEHSHFVSKSLSRLTLGRPKLKHVIHDPESGDHRLVLLAEHTTEPVVVENKIAELKKSLPVEIVSHTLELDYSYFSVDQVLKEVLPEGCEVPASFETVGHIAHVNLRDDHLPFKKVIADVFLDKNQPRIRSVVNKVGTISNEFRVPTWEVLAGDTNLVTEVKQNNAIFRLDFGLVYWNSRLEFEHKRLCSQFVPGEIVLDMFAGVGPFAIPAAQRQCLVLANDLNPASVTYLKVNAKVNKVAGNIRAYNLDGRQFMRDLQNIEKSESTICDMAPVTRSNVRASSGKVEGSKLNTAAGAIVKPWEFFHHVVMNLPASAIEFLDVFKGLLSKETWRGPMPRVHCYCFMRASETTSDVLQRAESFLGASIPDPQVCTVRDVAPNKVMLCISFFLPRTIAFQEARDLNVPKNGSVSDMLPSSRCNSSQSKRPKFESS